jgi:hypothetical protein
MPATLIVGTSAELLAALAKAQTGARIRLKPGVYSGLGTIDGAAFASDIALTSDDPARPAVLTNFNLANCHGLTLDRLKLQALPGLWSFRINGCKDVQLTRIELFGPVTPSLTDAPMGILIQNCDGLTISDSDFHHVNTALSASKSRRLVYERNRFHDLVSDASDISDSRGVTIRDNFVTSIFASATDHPDAFQFWTEKAALTEVTVSGNIITRGSGNVDPQGIFFSARGTGQPMSRITVDGNFLSGAGANGIVILGDTAGARTGSIVITNNTVLSVGQASRIRVEHGDGVHLSGNVATSSDAKVGSTAVSDGGVKTKGATAKDGGKEALAAFRAARPSVPR